MAHSTLRYLTIPEHVRLPSELVTGITVVDEQHRMLLSQYEFMRGKRHLSLTSEFMGDCLHDIGQTLMEHFKTEEDVMRYSRVPADELARHVEDHFRIIDEYVALQGLVMTKPHQHIHDVLGTVENWVIQHIANFDVPALKLDTEALSQA